MESVIDLSKENGVHLGWAPPADLYPIQQSGPSIDCCEVQMVPTRLSLDSPAIHENSMFDVFGQDDELQDAQPSVLEDPTLIVPASPALTLEVSNQDAARKLMDTWLEIHHEDPYLKQGDAEALSHLTGLTVQQVRTYMNNTRSRKLPKADLSSSRVGSATSLHSFASSSSQGPRKGRRRHRSSSASLGSLAKVPKDKIYQCTWCGEAFGRKSDWKRHEQSIHLPQEEWICMPSYPAGPDEENSTTCGFCGMKLGVVWSILASESPFPSTGRGIDHIENHLQVRNSYGS